ncbi:hypothetical protein F5883DRAFT_203970 [Diaporthe sp. PMI_573]|nr:hypothetical protein F5883DRAFT_203970 [Diaporthaceae sp. PMI_573]
MVWSVLVSVWSRPPRLGLVWRFLETMVRPVRPVRPLTAINRSGWLNLSLMQLEYSRIRIRIRIMARNEPLRTAVLHSHKTIESKTTCLYAIIMESSTSLTPSPVPTPLGAVCLCSRSTRRRLLTPVTRRFTNNASLNSGSRGVYSIDRRSARARDMHKSLMSEAESMAYTTMSPRDVKPPPMTMVEPSHGLSQNPVFMGQYNTSSRPNS